MRWWGPLGNVSEFAGKRVNGMLQKMKTNGIVGQIEGTVLREFCQTQRLNSQAQNWSFEFNDRESKSETARLVKVHPELYAGMLQKLQFKDSTLQHYQDLPHPDGSCVLTPYANKCDAFKSKSGLYISKTKQNRLVAYQKDGSTGYGWITHIYSLPNSNGRILMAVKVLRDACMGDVIDISENFIKMLNNLQLKVVKEDSSRELLDPE
ncbi:hypothetical protein PtB15_13B198 [Puccinia triticina]|nr:hypothetical protein PtB15_13B198 [Puccinia triticina]